MVGPFLALALSFFGNKGAYALLLGSGVSKDSQILTGWEIGLRFIQDVCRLVGEDPGGDPGAWFEERYGKPPTYSNVLEAFDPSQGGRSGLLRSHFEPTQEQREAGVKVPSVGHHAIAALAAEGYVRVVLTTNFDSLLEQALDGLSVPHQVIASPDDADGARPFILEPCTVIKVNGDYRDTRIKNTDDELAAYDRGMETVIRRVLGDFGLIVCGWSADSDVALARLIQTTPSRLFPTYWTHRSAPRGMAADLIAARGAQPIRIDSASAFFRQLREDVASLGASVAQPSLDAAAVYEAVKRYVAEDRHRIQLEDLVRRTTKETLAALPDHQYQGGGSTGPTATPERLRVYEAVTERLRAAVVAGCRWGSPEHRHLWSTVITQLAALPGEENVYRSRPDRRLYPAALTMHAGGIAAVAGSRYDHLAELLLRGKARVTGGDRQTGPALLGLKLTDVLHEAEIAQLGDTANRVYAFQSYLRETLRPSFASLVVRERDFDEWFDRFEYLAMLAYARLNRELSGKLWAPRAGMMLRGRYGDQERREVVGALLEEAGAQDDDWGAVRAGLFGSAAEFERLVEETAPWADVF